MRSNALSALNDPSNDQSKDLEAQSSKPFYLTNVDYQKLVDYGHAHQHISAEEVDDLIREHWQRYYANYLLMILGSTSWLTTIPFQVEECIGGVEAVASVFDATLDSRASLGISIALGIAGVLPLIIALPVQELAITRTLKSVQQNPLPLRMGQAWQDLKTKPIPTLYDGLVDVATFSSNITAALVPAIGFATLFDIQSVWKKILLAITLGPLQFVYYGEYYKPVRGIDYLKDQVLFSMYELIRDGDLVTAMHIFLQGWICAAGLRAYPFYKFTAEESWDYAGVWLPVYMVVACNFVQTILTILKPVSERFLKSRVQLEALLLNENKTLLQELVRRDLEKNPGDPEKALLKNVRHMREDNLERYADRQDYFYILKAEPVVGLLLAIRTTLGAYLGSLLVAEFDDSPLATGLSATAAGLLFAMFSWRGDARRVNHNLCDADRQKKACPVEEKLSAVVVPSRPISLCEILTVSGVGTLLIIAASAITFATTVGTLQSPDKAETVIVTLLGFERAITSVLYNEMIKRTMRGWFSSKHGTVKTLFHQIRPKTSPEAVIDVKEPDEKPRSGWFCWRK